MKSTIRILSSDHSVSGIDQAAVSPDDDVVNIEYHVIYSLSYDVPTIYFTAAMQGSYATLLFLSHCLKTNSLISCLYTHPRTDGSCLEIERIWSSIPQVICQPPVHSEQEKLIFKRFGDVITQMVRNLMPDVNRDLIPNTYTRNIHFWVCPSSTYTRVIHRNCWRK